MIDAGEADRPTSDDVRLEALLDGLDRASLRFTHAPDRAGVDLGVDALLDGLPNRARVKLFMPSANTAAAWFYKDSQVHFSTDRFSYGAVVMKGEPLTDDAVADLVTWIESGLHPERRPKAVRRAFPFTIPD